MRIAAPIILAMTLLAPFTASVEAARRPAYEPKAKSCARLSKRVLKTEQKSSARCGDVQGCNAKAVKRYEKLTATFASKCVRLNQIQALGSHNSYHVHPQEPLWSELLAATGETFFPWDYSHLPLDQQFASQNVRQIEIDVFADPDGGLYRNRKGRTIIGGPVIVGPPELDEPGFKVFHVQDLDFETTCLSFVDCLEVVRGWSDTNPGHLPIAILVELKDDALIPSLVTTPVPIGPAELDALDAEIRSVFSEEQMITPDDVRGDAATLEEAVLTRGWPTLAWAKGKVIFLMDNSGRYRDDYVAGHPNLEGRALFTNSSPGQPDAGFIKMNDPFDTMIPENVAAGYLVRTRSDADLWEGRENDTAPRQAAINSAAHWVSTDFPAPRPELGSDYSVQIPGGMPARCNPANAPEACRASALE